MFERQHWPISLKHEHRLLGLLLIMLHFSEGWDLGNEVARILLMSHLVLFVLWQPLWGTRDSISLRNVVTGLGLAACFVVFFSGWLLILWKIILMGLLGGRDLVRTRDRLVNYAAVLFLLGSVFVLDINRFFVLELFPYHTELWVHWAFLLIPATFLLIPRAGEEGRHCYLDFNHALTFSLLILIVVLSLLFLMHHQQIDYHIALLRSIGMVLALLAVLVWLWVVFAGAEDFSRLWSRNLLNIGSSFEQWLAGLAQPGNLRQLSPEQFLYTGLEQLVTVPWITGIVWNSPYGQGKLGEEDKYKTTVIVQSLEITVYARQRIRGTHYAHVKLLIQLLEHFHQSRRREEAFAKQAHLQAVHETGAKLTHDIKNLLQSLHAITSAIETVQPERFGDTQRLLQGQLPHLSQRLKRTLDKLKQPEEISYTHIALRTWWDNLCARYRKREVDFSMNIMWNPNIPEDLFDNVLENLLENALNKRRREPDLRIQVTLTTGENQIRLTVCDDGTPIPPQIEKSLLSEPVPSRDGFGIGLYQAVKQTIHSGYRLEIKHNEPGQVCFELLSV